MSPARGFACSAAVALGYLLAAHVSAAAEPAPSFTRDIKGILSNRCVRCHGPDGEDRHGGGDDGLRLDTFAGATADLGGDRAGPARRERDHREDHFHGS
jgi:mono/diheme cytochrome c family protein